MNKIDKVSREKWRNYKWQIKAVKNEGKDKEKVKDETTEAGV